MIDRCFGAAWLPCYPRCVHLLFLEIDTESSWSVASLGPASLAAYLRLHGHQASLLRVGLHQGADEVLAAIAQCAPGLLGVSITTRQWLRARDLLAALRGRGCQVPVILGGLHATFAPEDVLRHPGIDYVCLGEGEQALQELMDALATQGHEATARQVRLGRVANLWARGGLKPGLRPPFEPLDALPFAARDLLDERWGVAHVSTQRGCPFPCTYCAARMYDELYAEAAGADYGRRRSVDHVLGELRALRAAGPLSYVIFLDDTFTIHHPWVHAFCQAYGPEFGLPFSLHARVETITPRLLQALVAAGCRHIVYGVESGSERVRREIMKRTATNQRFRDVFRASREAGLLVTANYILGTPGESVAEMEETLALHEQLQPDDFGFFVFYPYPGTALYRQCLASGWLPPDHLELPAVHSRSILRLPGVSAAEIEAMYQRWTEARARGMLRRMPGATTEQAQHVHALATAHAQAG
jgi:radical SAM superfamily enzyme YgiQ (UPF0313 family)